MKSKEVRNILEISQPTLSKYVKEGKIRVIKINKYHYIYNQEDVYALIGQKVKKGHLVMSYSRVSTGKQKSQLKEQTNRIYQWSILNGLTLDNQFEEILSGMNFNRPVFLQIIEQIIQGNVSVLIVENKDRLVRFGFELLENIFKYFNCKILVINDSIQNKSYEQELTEDLLSIIHYFSMKSYSHRRKLNKLKKELEVK
jgi:predicted site-specific integrase-resolvase